MYLALFQRNKMRMRHIHNMDVVALAGAVAGGVCIAKNCQQRVATADHLREIWEQIVGFAFGVFPNLARAMGACGVEIAQAYCRGGLIGASPVSCKICSIILYERP